MTNSTQKGQLNPIFANKKNQMPTDLSIKIIQQFASSLYVESKLSILENSFILN